MCTRNPSGGMCIENTPVSVGPATMLGMSCQSPQDISRIHLVAVLLKKKKILWHWINNKVVKGTQPREIRQEELYKTVSEHIPDGTRSCVMQWGITADYWKLCVCVCRKMSDWMAPLWEDVKLLQGVRARGELLAGRWDVSESERLARHLQHQRRAAVHPQNRPESVWAQRPVQVSVSVHFVRMPKKNHHQY